MTPDQGPPLEQASLSGSAALAGQVAELIRLVASREEDNIQRALRLAKGLNNPRPFQQYLKDLLPLDQIAFKSGRPKIGKGRHLIVTPRMNCSV